MPRPHLPPTPASSTDIPAKENAGESLLPSIFTLPPPAIASIPAGSDSSSVSAVSGSSYDPRSAATNVTARKRRQSQDHSMGADFRLPPPPTRSRRIIQMKPGLLGPAKPSSTAPTSPEKSRDAPVTKTLRKQPSATSGAGKKTARKTAHSIIERRRRSKMNEEFGVLKRMIPACSGQEMHKLAILQAGIDYVRYLEQCIQDLKAANNSHSPKVQPTMDQEPGLKRDTFHQDYLSDDNEDDNEDVDMDPSEPATLSPTLQPTGSRDSLHGFYVSSLPSPSLATRQEYASSYASTIASQQSPAVGPQGYQPHQYGYYEPPKPSYGHQTYVSPMILPRPMHDADHEATSALLMLNHDRRHLPAEGRARGISVRDLITS